ncbi:abl interactor 1-like isoform X1 [Cloeon dipterum]|uniref:abl interactor 1-like isoform X1 n=1 Tax=Cloeon dipterum TaxID=197152 RepID=UPI00321F8FC4
MNFKKPRNSAPLVPIRPPPPPPGQAAAPSGRQNNGAPSKKGVMNLSKLIPKRMQKNQSSGSSSNRHETVTKKSAPPPRPPPPKFAPKQPVLIDLLSGSPPSSPSPTLRSQESGFEESPDVWKSWPESSASTPMVDWTVGPAASADPWDSAGWSSSSGGMTSNAGWATFDGAESQRQLSEVRSTTMPTLNSAAATLSAVRSTPSMPTIIRPGGPKKLVKKDKVDDIFEDDQSPPMPSFPPPQLPQDVEDTCNEPTVFHVVAVFDYESDHPEDLSFKAGEVIEVLSMVNEDWYTGQCGDRLGHFPANFVEPQ